ncbi:hypothetical protein HYS99_01765 [Candidatus Giovannonibacteria bacterium]|nr:hypothetical protein [Candidatus Giovannonibacteria bacterium]
MGTASMTTGQFREFAGAVLRSLPDDLDPTTAQGWIENQESLRKILREALTPDGKPAGNTYPLSVDYGRGVECAVKSGRYDWANSDVTSRNFPTERKGTVEVAVELIHFNRHISTGEVHRELDRMGYRPAELHELLAFGEKYPEVQREFLIVALGSVWQDRGGDLRVPRLSRDGSERTLYLGWVEDGWDEIYRFAAIRK